MPLYEYMCEECGHRSEEFHSIHSDGPDCPECGSATYHRVPSVTHTDLKEFRKPIEMMSIGLNDDEEIREFKQRCPDVHVPTDPNDDLYGVPIAKNRKQKLQALNAVGFEEKN